MSLTSRFNSLLAKHAKLEQQIYDSQSNHISDLTLKQLKKQKLKLKETIVEFNQRYNGKLIESS
jgi:uncharacterized protein YdcH (DUF465 family)